MGMKPRLEESFGTFTGVVNNPKKVPETSAMPSNLVTSAKPGTTGPLVDSTLVTRSSK